MGKHQTPCESRVAAALCAHLQDIGATMGRQSSFAHAAARSWQLGDDTLGATSGMDGTTATDADDESAPVFAPLNHPRFLPPGFSCTMRSHPHPTLFTAAFCVLAVSSFAADWPMWRCDAGRTASTEEKLPAALRLEWERRYTPRVQVWDDPLNHDMMTYDKVFEPVVAGDRMFIGFNDSDKVVALDLTTGATVWIFYTDGPVRLAPVAWKGKVYFTSDDGLL
jgi:hypothetical protein